jgi:hypothetical protein
MMPNENNTWPGRLPKYSTALVLRNTSIVKQTIAPTNIEYQVKPLTIPPTTSSPDNTVAGVHPMKPMICRQSAIFETTDQNDGGVLFIQRVMSNLVGYLLPLVR